MEEDYRGFVQILQKIADRLREGKISLRDIREEDIQVLVQNIFNKDICEMYFEVYKFIARYGDAGQQGSVISLLKELIQYYDEKTGKLLEQRSAYTKYQDIITAYSENELTDEFISGKTWESVALLKDEKKVKLFSRVCDAVNERNIERIKKQSKIKIAFLTKDSAEWSVDVLYQKLLHDERYEVYVIVAPFFVGTDTTIKDTYELAVKYFVNKEYPVVGICDILGERLSEKGEPEYFFKSWDDMPKPDVLFLLNPHYKAFLNSSSIINFPLQTLMVYIPYGFSLYGNIHDQYNQLSHALCWKIFWETEMDIKISRKYADLGDRNGEVSGYLKMDGFYGKEYRSAEEIWEIPEGETAGSVKKIIYAPHWSIRRACTGFGNFDKMYDKILQYAKEHADTTTWIFRPHPMLRYGVVGQGLFASEAEFDDYMKKWDELPNARVMERGEYIDIFRTSDALIGDSISFLGEYQYTHKPLLFITREENTFDDFGEELIKILYQARGEDFESVVKFINEVVVREKDTMYEAREKFFEKYLDYKTRNGKLASDYIKEYLDRTFENVKK